MGMLIDPYRFVSALPSISFLTSATSTADTNTYTFSGLTFGAADPERFIAVGVVYNAGSAFTVTSMTIGGVAATVNVVGANGGLQVVIGIAKVPTGTSGSVVVNLSGTALRAGVGVYRILNIGSTTAFATNSGSGSGSASADVNFPANGVGFGVASNTAPSTESWSGLSVDVNVAPEGQIQLSTAQGSTTTAQMPRSISASGTGNNAIATASWGP